MRPIFTKEEDQYIIDNVQDMTWEELADDLNKNPKSIINRYYNVILKHQARGTEPPVMYVANPVTLPKIRMAELEL